MTDHHGRLPKVPFSYRGILQAHILQRISLLFVIICTYCPRLKSMALRQTGSTVRNGDTLPVVEMLQLSRRKYVKCIRGLSCIQNEELISYLSDHPVPPYSVPVSDKPKTGNPTKPSFGHAVGSPVLYSFTSGRESNGCGSLILSYRRTCFLLFFPVCLLRSCFLLFFPVS